MKQDDISVLYVRAGNIWRVVGTYQWWIKSWTIDADAWVGVLVCWGVRGAVYSDSTGVLGKREPRRVVLAGADALPRDGVRDKGAPALTALGGTRAGSSSRGQRRRTAAASGAQWTSTGSRRRRVVRCRLPRHQQLQKKRIISFDIRFRSRYHRLNIIKLILIVNFI